MPLSPDAVTTNHGFTLKSLLSPQSSSHTAEQQFNELITLPTDNVNSTATEGSTHLSFSAGEPLKSSLTIHYPGSASLLAQLSQDPRTSFMLHGHSPFPTGQTAKMLSLSTSDHANAIQRNASVPPQIRFVHSPLSSAPPKTATAEADPSCTTSDSTTAYPIINHTSLMQNYGFDPTATGAAIIPMAADQSPALNALTLDRTVPSIPDDSAVEKLPSTIGLDPIRQRRHTSAEPQPCGNQERKFPFNVLTSREGSILETNPNSDTDSMYSGTTYSGSVAGHHGFFHRHSVASSSNASRMEIDDDAVMGDRATQRAHSLTPDHDHYHKAAQPTDTHDAHRLSAHTEEDDNDRDNGEAACMWDNCTLTFPTMSRLVDHLSHDHIGCGKSSYVCGWRHCSRHRRSFTKRHKLFNHLRTHTGEKPFPCPVEDCIKSFSRPDSLATHIKTHSDIRPYVCSVRGCGKSYYHGRSLRKHEKTHTLRRHTFSHSLYSYPSPAAAAITGPTAMSTLDSGHPDMSAMMGPPSQATMAPDFHSAGLLAGRGSMYDMYSPALQPSQLAQQPAGTMEIHRIHQYQIAAAAAHHQQQQRAHSISGPSADGYLTQSTNPAYAYSDHAATGYGTPAPDDYHSHHQQQQMMAYHNHMYSEYQQNANPAFAASTPAYDHSAGTTGYLPAAQPSEYSTHAYYAQAPEPSAATAVAGSMFSPATSAMQSQQSHGYTTYPSAAPYYPDFAAGTTDAAAALETPDAFYAAEFAIPNAESTAATSGGKSGHIDPEDSYTQRIAFELPSPTQVSRPPPS